MNHVREFKDISGRDCVQVLVTGSYRAIYHIGGEIDEEVAAYYRKREDERLGRESFEVDGELFYVFVDENRPAIIMVSNAATGEYAYSYGIEPMKNPQMPIWAAYNMWFEAHKPPKEPQEGEIWDVRTGETYIMRRCVVRDGWFVSVYADGPSCTIDDKGIVRKEFVL